MLRTEDLHIQRGRKTVLAGVTLAVQPGEVLGVLGPNGAGKSTLLGALSGELRAEQGQVWLDQRELSQWPGAERAQRLAVLPQASTLDFAFRVEEVVGMGRLPHQTGRVRDDEIVGAALDAADVSHLHGRSYLGLSGGERQRVHLARALAQEPTDLILDEPTNHLDIHHQLDILRLIAGLPITTIVALHDLNLAAMFCDRLAIMRDGRLVAAGTPQEVLTESLIAQVFSVRAIVAPSTLHRGLHIQYLP